MNPSGQSSPGTKFTPGGNPKSVGTKGSDPLAGPTGRLSTGTKHSSAKAANDLGGKLIEGQNLRGYVHNEKARNIGKVTDATVAADGTKRVRSL